MAPRLGLSHTGSASRPTSASAPASAASPSPVALWHPSNITLRCDLGTAWRSPTHRDTRTQLALAAVPVHPLRFEKPTRRWQQGCARRTVLAQGQYAVLRASGCSLGGTGACKGLISHNLFTPAIKKLNFSGSGALFKAPSQSAHARSLQGHVRFNETIPKTTVLALLG